jgi:hypothetical protein
MILASCGSKDSSLFFYFNDIVTLLSYTYIEQQLALDFNVI